MTKRNDGTYYKPVVYRTCGKCRDYGSNDNLNGTLPERRGGMNKKTFKTWLREKDEAVRSFDTETFRKFFLKWQKLGIYEKYIKLPKDEVLEITIRKMACHSPTLTDEERETAKKWLEERGMTSDL